MQSTPRALGEQVFDVAEAEREPEAEPNRPLNGLRQDPVTRVLIFVMFLWLPRIQSASKMPAP